MYILLSKYLHSKPSSGLTFNIEIHGLADICSNIVADSTQVEATVFLQHVFDKQGAIYQHLDAKAWVEGNGFELGDSSACEGKQNKCLLQYVLDQNTTEGSPSQDEFTLQVVS